MCSDRPTYWRLPIFQMWIHRLQKVEEYLKENDIKFLFFGHRNGDNLESPKRVTDIKILCSDMHSGKVEGIKSEGYNGSYDVMADGDGFLLTYSSQAGIKLSILCQ